MSNVTTFITDYVKANPEADYTQVAKMYALAFYGKEPKRGLEIYTEVKKALAPKPAKKTPIINKLVFWFITLFAGISSKEAPKSALVISKKIKKYTPNTTYLGDFDCSNLL